MTNPGYDYRYERKMDLEKLAEAKRICGRYLNNRTIRDHETRSLLKQTFNGIYQVVRKLGYHTPKSNGEEK